MTSSSGGGGYYFTPSAITPRVVVLTDAATIAVNSDITDTGTVTIAGNRTLGTPTGTPAMGQTFELRVTQPASGGPWTLTLSSGYALPSGVSFTVSTAANAVDLALFRYDSTSTKWQMVGLTKGF